MTVSIACKVIEVPGRRSASARLVGRQLEITVPSRLSTEQKQRLVQELSKRAMRHHQRQEYLLISLPVDSPRVSLNNPIALSAFVRQVNANTLQSSRLTAIRMGRARHSRLAQMNTRTGVMTVSCFCLSQAPTNALRYLVIHELCHLVHANHSAAFWQLVAQYVPDWKYQSQVMQAHHYWTLWQSDTSGERSDVV